MHIHPIGGGSHKMSGRIRRLSFNVRRLWGLGSQKDVTIRAGDLDEMAWHLFTWGDAVEVIEPAELRERLRELKNL